MLVVNESRWFILLEDPNFKAYFLYWGNNQTCNISNMSGCVCVCALYPFMLVLCCCNEKIIRYERDVSFRGRRQLKIINYAVMIITEDTGDPAKPFTCRHLHLWLVLTLWKSFICSPVIQFGVIMGPASNPTSSLPSTSNTISRTRKD